MYARLDPVTAAVVSDAGAGVPEPVDDGAAVHLAGMRLPAVALGSTSGTHVDLAALAGTVIVFAFPRTGRPDEPPLVDDWAAIPGALGCTPQTCAFRDLHAELAALGARVFGLSTQTCDERREMVERLHVPFEVLGDAELALATALRLPTLRVAGRTMLRRLTWIARDGVIARVFYPVFPPQRNAADVLAALREPMRGRSSTTGD